MLLHEGGCGGNTSGLRSPGKLLAGYIHNPNVAGATILSLGCQNAEIKTIQEKLKAVDPTSSKPVIILDQQQSGTEQQLLSRAIQETFLALVEANKIERTPAPLSKLTVD